jgi:mono/diheme cytochrome c family protein
VKIIKVVLVTLVISSLIGVLAIGAYMASGGYNVAATAPHTPPVKWLLGTAVHRSIAVRSAGIKVPSLGNATQLRQGARSYDAMCAGCHAPPGRRTTALARGLYPAPPDLTHTAEHHSPGYVFWAVKHGIKASGMPAWGPTHDDADLWPIVALVMAFPGMDAATYERLSTSTADAGAQSHPQEPGASAHQHDHAH